MNGLVTVSYIGATVLFILALGGLSNQETARRGNVYGVVGMALALLATVLGVVTANYAVLFGALVVGGALGTVLARRVQMTQMPELVAILHSLVGLAAMLVGFANFGDPTVGLTGVEKTAVPVGPSVEPVPPAPGIPASVTESVMIVADSPASNQP
jgi:NAD(P) transhydrogenase subunit beta